MRRLADLVVRWPLAVIGVWIAIAIALPLAFPSLGQMAEKHPLAILPGDAPSSVAAAKMKAAFQEPGSDNLLVVTLINEKGLTARRRGHLSQARRRASATTSPTSCRCKISSAPPSCDSS